MKFDQVIAKKLFCARTILRVSRNTSSGNFEFFLKPFLKGKILRSSERGVNSILTTILRF